jgi:hypothetical protein
LEKIKVPNLIELSDADLDQRAYRIYALDRFVALLRMKKDAVVNPTKWDDPFENVFFLFGTDRGCRFCFRYDNSIKEPGGRLVRPVLLSD